MTPYLRLPTRPSKQPDPRGRVDIAVFRLLEKAAKSDPVGAILWENGMGAAIEEVICKNLPRHNVLDLFGEIHSQADIMARVRPFFSLFEKKDPPGRRLGIA